MEKKQRSKTNTPLTEDAREAYLANLALELLEQRLLDGTATSQEVTTIIKQASTGKLEREKIRLENDLLKVKKNHIEAETNQGELAAAAIEAMKKYSGCE